MVENHHNIYWPSNKHTQTSVPRHFSISVTLQFNDKLHDELRRRQMNEVRQIKINTLYPQTNERKLEEVTAITALGGWKATDGLFKQ